MDVTTNPVDEVQEFENLIIFSHRFLSLLKSSAIFEGTGLSVESFSLLSAVAAEPGVPVQKAMLRASITDKDEQKTIRQALAADGLVTEKSAGGGKKGLELTEKGAAALDTVKAQLSAVVGKAEVKSWRAVPRLASIVRTLRPALAAADAS